MWHPRKPRRGRQRSTAYQPRARFGRDGQYRGQAAGIRSAEPCATLQLAPHCPAFSFYKSPAKPNSRLIGQNPTDRYHQTDKANSVWLQVLTGCVAHAPKSSGMDRRGARALVCGHLGSGSTASTGAATAPAQSHPSGTLRGFYFGPLWGPRGFTNRASELTASGSAHALAFVRAFRRIDAQRCQYRASSSALKHDRPGR